MAGADDLIAEVVEQRRAWEASLAEHGIGVPSHRYPEILPRLLDSGRLVRSYWQGETDRLLAEALKGVADENSLAVALRRFRREEMVRIIWRDIAAMAGLDETLEDLSALADACVDRALSLLHAWTSATNSTWWLWGWVSSARGSSTSRRTSTSSSPTPPVVKRMGLVR
jgi:glutamate-ammonia-ligase adenylyltransferase